MSGFQRQYGYAIAIPARNEEERIIGCLEACRDAMAQFHQSGVIAVLVNNSDDQTLQHIHACRQTIGVPIVVEMATFDQEHAHAGRARRAAWDLARSLVSDDGYLLTTDADSQPTSSWVEACLSLLAHHPAALICGSFQLLAEEYERLPHDIMQRGAIEDYYRHLSREVRQLLDPDPYNIWPFHGQISGASLALAASVYDRIGGAPIVPCAEDRALAQRFFEHDLPILYSAQAQVITSCRLDGRASGGMADTIANRVIGGQHLCDESVEPAAMVHLRADIRARLRAAFPSPSLCAAILSEVGLEAGTATDFPAFTGFGALWTYVERNAPRLRRKRLLWAEMVRELPHLEKLLEQTRTTSSPIRRKVGELVE